MSYKKTSTETYLASNGMEYYGWVGRHILDPDNYYSSKSNQEDEDNPAPESDKTKVNMRWCRRCHKEKNVSQFPKRALMSLTYHRICKECRAKINAEKKKWARYLNQKYQKNRKESDPIYNFMVKTRSRLRGAVKNKTSRTEELLGCSGEYAFEYLVSQFTDDMSIESFLKGDIHIDHIRPIASYDMENPDHVKECFHYTNLQPLWASDNLIKGAKWEE